MTELANLFESMTLAELEKWAIETAMSRNDNRILAVAKELAVGKTTIYRKLGEYYRERRKGS